MRPSNDISIGSGRQEWYRTVGVDLTGILGVGDAEAGPEGLLFRHAPSPDRDVTDIYRQTDRQTGRPRYSISELDTDWMHPWIGLDWVGLDWVECWKNLDGLDWIAANG